MIQISKNVTVDGFETKEEFEKWLKEQKESNKDTLKIFKWHLMQLEEDTEKEIYNKDHWEAVDKYAIRVIERKIMSEESVIKFIGQAQSSMFKMQNMKGK